MFFKKKKKKNHISDLIACSTTSSVHWPGNKSGALMSEYSTTSSATTTATTTGSASTRSELLDNTPLASKRAVVNDAMPLPTRAHSFYERGPSDRSSSSATSGSRVAGGGGGGLQRHASAAILRDQLVTVNDQAERILSIRTSTSGRRTFTHTDTGRVIVQPVFFSPGGLVSNLSFLNIIF